MKRLKITSVLLSVVMCVTMAFPSIGVIADEAAEPTETQTEATEKKQETKAPEKKQTTKAPEKKQEPKETEKKEEPKETVKQEPKETEKKEEPKETAKQEPKETEKKEEPTEPEKQDPTESKNEEPTEPEKEEPTEPEKEEPTEPKEEEPTESKREEPTEPEKQEPTESETEAPSETETQAPEETEPEKEPEATEVPGGKVTKAPKNAVSFSNVNLNQSTGIMTWDAVPGANCYLIVIDNYDGGYEIWLDELNGGSEIDPWYEENCWEVEKDERSVDLHKVIRTLIKSDYLDKADDNKYYIYILAFSDGYDFDQYLEGYAGMCTPYKTTLVYETNLQPVKPAAITGVSFSGGKMSWNKPSDAVHIYYIEISNEESSVGFSEEKTSVDINAVIDDYIRDRFLFKLGKKWTIKIDADDEDIVTIASWEGEYTYDSKASPKTIPNVKAVLSGDNLTWNAFSGADHYDIRVIGSNIRWSNDHYDYSCNLKNEIFALIDEYELKEVGVYSIELYAVDDCGQYIAMWKGTYTYKQMPNTLDVSGKTAKVKKKKVRKKKQTLNVGKVIKFKNRGQGKITYSKISGSKKISINGSNGKVTVKKKTKKGTYKVSVWVKAAGDSNHLSAKKKVTFKIKVK